MKIKYLGTGSAAGFPAQFCNCQYCKSAKALGGKNIRTRSQALIDDKLLIDYPSDSYMHFVEQNVDLPHIHALLITHTHQDHLYLEDLGLRSLGFSLDIDGELCVYGNDAVLRKYNAMYGAGDHLKGKLVCKELTEFVPVDIEGYEVTPLLANHDKNEKCFIYLVKKDDTTLLYGNDTGFFPESTWEHLRGKKLQMVSLDCSYIKYKEGTNHMGIPDVLEVKKRLYELQCADDATKFIVTHFSHIGQWLHEEIVEAVTPHHITVAYDGLEVAYK